MDCVRIPHLGLLLTTLCNLNCHKCADLIPYRPHKTYNPIAAISDLEKMVAIADEISEVLLIGGEVLLYKDLHQVLKYCQEQEKIKKVIITTNGTIFPDEKLWKLLQNGKTVLRISGYPFNVAPRRERLVQEVRCRRIKCEDLCNMQWKNVGNNRRRNRSIKVMKSVFNACSMKDCVTLNSEGVMFFCSRQMGAFETDDYPTPIPGEFVNIRELSLYELVHALHHFYSLDYISTCDYCDGININSTNIETAKQILPKNKYIKIVKTLFTIKSTVSINQQLELVDKIVDILLPNLAVISCRYGVYEFLENLKRVECKNDSLYIDGKRTNLYAECMSLVVSLSSDYRYGIFDNHNNLLNGRKCLGNDRNYVRVYLGEPENKQFDLLVTKDELGILYEVLDKSDWFHYE